MELLPALANASGWAVAVATFLVVFRAITKDDLVPGETHRRALRQAEFWRDRALVGTHLAGVATEAAKATTDAE